MTRAYNTATTQQNSGGAVAGFAAGKNKIINGDFNIWQRGTSFAANIYNSDRWSSGTDASVTFSRQTFTPGTAPVAGYEGTYFCRADKSAGGTYLINTQRIEDVRTFAGQAVTLSFWAKASTAVSVEPYYTQVFGSGGSADVGGVIGSAVSLTTSWVRYSFNVTIPSVSGKTIGTSSYLNILALRYVGSAAVVLDMWGVQLEAGSVATAFQTATGTIQGELAACQRYFWAYNVTDSNTQSFNAGLAISSTRAIFPVRYPVPMRGKPTLGASANSNFVVIYGGYSSAAATGISLNNGGAQAFELDISVASGLTTGNAAMIGTTGNASAYLWLSAEL